eukprot:Em0087g10a
MMLDSAGIYTGDEDASDQDLFVVERKTFKSLCSGLVQQCGCLSNPSWTIASFIKYMNFNLFAGMGVVKQKYISSVYLNQLYQQVVVDVAEESMKAAVERVKESPHHATSGEWVITDARHDSTSNAYHSTVPCLAGRQQHRVAQTREVACTKIVLPQVIARGLNITEVAYDYQATIKLYVRQLGMVNSYDPWHGKGEHQSCYSESPCQQPGYVPQRKPLTMPAAISAYEAALRKTLIYKNADSCHLNIRSMYVLRNITSQQILQDEDDDEMVLPDDAALYDGDYVDSEDDDYVCSKDGGDDEEEDN